MLWYECGVFTWLSLDLDATVPCYAHRDLKALLGEDILLDEDLHTQTTDFGTAKIAEIEKVHCTVIHRITGWLSTFPDPPTTVDVNKRFTFCFCLTVVQPCECRSEMVWNYFFVSVLHTTFAVLSKILNTYSRCRSYLYAGFCALSVAYW